MKYGSQIDTMGIPIKSFVPEQATAFPGAPVNGQVIHRTDQNATWQYLGGQWVRLDNNGIAAAPDATTAVKGIVMLADNATTITGTDATKATTPAGVKAAINALINAAPGTLDTLAELATALGNDPNFATTITNALANKSDVSHAHGLATGSITGTLPLTKGGTGATTEAAARNALLVPYVQDLGNIGALVAGTEKAVATSVTWTSGAAAAFFRDASTGTQIDLDFRFAGSNLYVKSDVAFATNTVYALIMGRPD